MSDTDRQGQFPDPQARKPEETPRERLRRVLRANKGPVLSFGAIILILVILAVWLASISVGTTRQGAAQIHQPQFDASKRNATIDPPPPYVTPPPIPDPRYQAFLACQQDPKNAACHPQQQTVSRSDDFKQKLAELQWKARFAPPDGGKGAHEVPQTTPNGEPRPQPQVGESTDTETSSAENQLAKNVTNAPYDQAVGPLYLLLGGITQISARLINEIAGEMAGPVIAQVCENVWSWGREVILIPKGSYLSGTYERVSDEDQERIMISIESIVMPDAYRISFPKASALDQTGQTALTDQVNHHYAQIFLTSIAISGIGAAAQAGGGGGYTYSPVGILRVGFGQGASQAGMRVFERFMNRKPTIKIRSGVVMNILAPVDMQIPAWKDHRMNPHI